METTWEDLLQSLLQMTPKDRQKPVVLFDYQTDKFIPLPDLTLCVEGKPKFHLTIN